MSEVDARALLQADPYAFVVTTAVRSSSTIPEGTVIEINPGPGALLPKGSDVTIVVSTGPEPVTVAPVIGQTEGRARNTLTEDGLVVRVQSTGRERGKPRRRSSDRPEPGGGFARRSRHRDHDHRRAVAPGADDAPADGPTHHRRSHHGPADHRSTDHRAANDRSPGTHDHRRPVTARPSRNCCPSRRHTTRGRTISGIRWCGRGSSGACGGRAP